MFTVQRFCRDNIFGEGWGTDYWGHFIVLFYNVFGEGWRFYSYLILVLFYLKKKKSCIITFLKFFFWWTLLFLNYFIKKSLLYLKPDTSKIHCIFVIFYYFIFSLWKIDVLIIMKILWWFITFLAHFFLKHMLMANIGRILNK